LCTGSRRDPRLDRDALLGLDAHIVGFLQIIVYAGAIVVLFLFVIMLLNLQEEPEAFSTPLLVVLGMGGGVGFAAIVATAIRRAPLPMPPLRDGFGGTIPLAERLFTTYLLPFELTSILLLVAIVGAVVIGKKSSLVTAPAPLSWYLVLSAVLFGMGAMGVLSAAT
jgi:NADH:ubiquinone oxidoreductase subunit 6 (subunit J)